MAEYSKDNRFSIGWVIGGTVLMILVSLFGGFVSVALGIGSLWALLAVSAACYAIGGFVVGWKSAGSTILEPGIAAVAAIIIQLIVRDGQLPRNPVTLVIALAIPFCAACAGGWLGEQVQGDVIVTSDE